MEKIEQYTPSTNYNLPLSWLITPIYILFFFGILLVFQPILITARCISFRAFYRSLISMCRCITENLYLTAGTVFSYRGFKKLPKDRPLIIVANHQSMYDIPMMIPLFESRVIRFISKKQLARWIPSISFALRHNGSALIERTDRAQSLREIRRAAQETSAENGAIGLFPEGTRAKNGVIKKFKPAGFSALLEQMPNALIVPIAVGRSWELLRYNLLPIPARVKVSMVMLEPIEPAGKDPRQLLETIEGEIRRVVAGLG